MSPDFLAHVRTESDRFLEALRGTDPAAPVPSCPEWTAADLLWHLTDVHYTWAQVVARRLTDGDVVEAEVDGALSRPDSYDGLLELCARQTDALTDALAAADDAEAVWTWAEDQSVGFVRRFQAHEAMIHRIDAELASGRELTPLPAELATDGIDVVLRFSKAWRPGWADWQTSEVTGRILATDTGDEWTVRLGTWSGHSPDTGKTYDGQAALELTSPGGDPTFTVSAPAADLDAYLWHRPGFADVTVDGSPEGFTRFGELVRDGVQ